MELHILGVLPTYKIIVDPNSPETREYSSEARYISPTLFPFAVLSSIYHLHYFIVCYNSNDDDDGYNKMGLGWHFFIGGDGRGCKSLMHTMNNLKKKKKSGRLVSGGPCQRALATIMVDLVLLDYSNPIIDFFPTTFRLQKVFIHKTFINLSNSDKKKRDGQICMDHLQFMETKI